MCTGDAAWTPEVCKIMALLALFKQFTAMSLPTFRLLFKGLGPLFYLLLGCRSQAWAVTSPAVEICFKAFGLLKTLHRGSLKVWSFFLGRHQAPICGKWGLTLNRYTAGPSSKVSRRLLWVLFLDFPCSGIRILGRLRSMDVQ